MPHPSKLASQPAKRNIWPPVVACILIVLIIVFALLAHYSTAHSAPPPALQPTDQQLAQQISLGASAESQITVVGTLAPLGSFEYETSPLETRLAVVKRHAADALLRHEITRDQAVEVQSKGNSAYAVIAQAKLLCDAAAHTGKCQGPKRKAEQLLAEAKRQVDQIPDYAPDIQFAGH